MFGSLTNLNNIYNLSWIVCFPTAAAAKKNISPSTIINNKKNNLVKNEAFTGMKSKQERKMIVM